MTYTSNGDNGASYPTQSNPPVNAGTYLVTATVNSPYATGTGTGILTISKINASVTWGPLNLTLTGSAQVPTYTTNPPGLPLNLTFTNPGGYRACGTFGCTTTGTYVVPHPTRV